MRRGKFRPWEIDIILDIENCKLRGSAKRAVLFEYQKAVQGELNQGADFPLRFSEYLERREAMRIERKPAKRVSRPSIRPKTRLR